MNRLNIDDTDSDSDENTDGVIDPNRLWLDEWNTYFNTHEVVPEGMGIIRWWGVSCSFLFGHTTEYYGSKDTWSTISDVALSCTGLPCHHGIFSFK